MTTEQIAHGQAFDRYVWVARIAPLGVTTGPVLLAAAAWAGDHVTSLTSLVGYSVWALVLLVAGQLDGKMGKKREALLWASWGGRPTIRFLRHRDREMNVHTKAETLRTLAKLTKVPVPTEQQEIQDPKAVDAVYESYGDFLRRNTRNQRKFPLVAAENRSYGFRRNLIAMKSLGIGCSIAAILGCSARIWFASGGAIGNEVWISAAVGLVSVVVLSLWIWRFTETWVRTAAEAYALRLLETADQIEEE